jgi:hypothetical protein
MMLALGPIYSMREPAGNVIDACGSFSMVLETSIVLFANIMNAFASINPLSAHNKYLYLNETAKPQSSTKQQLELIKLFRQGDTGAMRKMIACNMQLVLDITPCSSVAQMHFQG